MTVWQLIAENRIQEAFEKGEFDDLPGAGKPLNLDDYFAAPAADRMAFSLLKNAGVLPPEMELLKQAELLESSLESCQDPIQRAKIQKQIQDMKVSMTMTLERRRMSARSNLNMEPPIA